MKYSNIIAIFLFSSVVFFYGCKDNSKNKETLNPTVSPNTSTPVSPSQNTAKVWHYTCAKGCAGGADTAVNCSACNGLLAHNTAFHKQVNNTQPPVIKQQSNTPPATEPSQNSAGVWHYTCAKGCAGGSGSVGSCGGCGDALAHNVAYHQ